MSHKPFEFVPGMPEGATTFVAGKLRHPDDLDDIIVDKTRSERIKAKYQKLVENGLYENNDLRSFANSQWNAIVHFDDKTLYVFTYPIIAAQPACYIKTCRCGVVLLKEQIHQLVEHPVDIEDVLDAIQLALDFVGDEVTAIRPPGRHPELGRNTDFDGDPNVSNPHGRIQPRAVQVDIDGFGEPIPFHPTYAKQTKEAD